MPSAEAATTTRRSSPWPRPGRAIWRSSNSSPWKTSARRPTSSARCTTRPRAGTASYRWRSRPRSPAIPSGRSPRAGASGPRWIGPTSPWSTTVRWRRRTCGPSRPAHARGRLSTGWRRWPRSSSAEWIPKPIAGSTPRAERCSLSGARRPSPTRSWRTPGFGSRCGAPAGNGWRRAVPGPSDCSGPAPVPRTRDPPAL